MGVYLVIPILFMPYATSFLKKSLSEMKQGSGMVALTRNLNIWEAGAGRYLPKLLSKTTLFQCLKKKK